MKRVTCCCENGRQTSNAPAWTSIVAKVVAWIVPGLTLAALPKCPLCLAAYVAVLTGCGISLAAARCAWWFVAASCVAVLLFLAIRTTWGLLR